MKKDSFDPYAKYRYKSNKKKHSKLYAVMFVSFCLIVVSIFSFCFSNFLVVGKVVNTNNIFVSSKKTVFALSLYSTSSKQDAISKSKQQNELGGAGYVFFANGAYKVISSIYPTQTECEKVRQNMLSTNPNCEILQIVLPQIKIKSSFSTKSEQSLLNSLELFYSTYFSLYNLSNQFDTQQIDQTTLKAKVLNLKQQNQMVINTFSSNFSTSTITAILQIKIYLNKSTQVLQNFLSLLESQIDASSTKKAYTEIVDLYLELCDEIN